MHFMLKMVVSNVSIANEVGRIGRIVSIANEMVCM